MRVLHTLLSRGDPNPARPGRTTGIHKRPVGRCEVTAAGVQGDVVADAVHHGGPDQAVYLYGEPDAAAWAAELGEPTPPGVFGENLRVSGLVSAGVGVGDRFAFAGGVVLEATAPRIPCATLAAVFAATPGFPKRFREATRPGVYARVLVEGTIEPGERVEHTPAGSAAHPPVTLGEVFAASFGPGPDAAGTRRLLAAPLSARERLKHEGRLAEMADREG